MNTENRGVCGCEEVCSLPPDQFRDRKAVLRRDVLPHVTRRRRLDNGWALEFPRTPAMERTLEDLVAFERRCCGTLSWNLDRPGARVLDLRIEGLSPDSVFFGILGDGAPEDGRERPPDGLLRATVAGGFGAGVSFLVCCAVPLGVAAVAGGAAAAPLAILDRPIFLALGAVAAAVTVWLWMRRRDRDRHA